jgi:hypothetical protein
MLELSSRAPLFGARDLLFRGGGAKQIPRFARDDNFVGSSLNSANINSGVNQAGVQGAHLGFRAGFSRRTALCAFVY